MTWYWDAAVGRYRDERGHFMARARVLEHVQNSLEVTGAVGDVLAGYAGQGALNAGDFGALFREEIKREYIRQYLLGIGGRGQMTAADWGSIGGMLREQYRFLDGFLAEIAAGDLTEAQVMARARMYINSAREAYERAHGKVAGKLGATEELWVLGVAEHCDDCLALAAEGWQPVGTFPIPGDGSTQCLTNCQCHKEYRDPAGKEL